MKIIIVLMLFIASPVWACSDFEDCMNTYTYEGKDVYGFEGKRLDGRDAKYVPVPSNNALLKAIAFKLEETVYTLLNMIEHLRNEELQRGATTPSTKKDGK